MTPTLGRIVHYTMSSQDAMRVNKRRKDASRSDVAKRDLGVVVHYGSRVSAGDILPAMITKVHENGNLGLRVFLDGTDVFWVQAAQQAEETRLGGRWFWPPRN